MKKQRGLTLVSLVVTIIILIILAGISINAILGENGIITIARQAKENMELAQIEEQTELNELYENMGAEGGIAGDLSYDAIAKLREFKKVIAEAITNEGVITNETDSIETMAENISKIKKEEITLEDLRIGDYIKYDTGVTSVGENGVIMCRVLYDTHSKYGLQIISNKNIEQVTLGGSDWEEGKKAYNSAIQNLNNEAEKYLNESFATDARCVGSIPKIDENGKFIQKYNGTETTVTLPLNIWTTYTRPTGWLSDDTGCYETDTNYIADYAAMKSIGIEKNGSFYLASRHVNNQTFACIFNIRVVHRDGEMFCSNLCYVGGAGDTFGYSLTYDFFSCFSLKSNLKITGGDGTTEETAYTIANS